jgi:hypothetical protein
MTKAALDADAVIGLYDYGVPAAAIAAQLGTTVPEVTAIIVSTTTARNTTPLPETDRERSQYERLLGQIRSLQAAGKHAEVEKRERILAGIRELVALRREAVLEKKRLDRLESLLRAARTRTACYHEDRSQSRTCVSCKRQGAFYAEVDKVLAPKT